MTPDNATLWQDICTAFDARQYGIVRVLCERYLQAEPENGAALLRLAVSLTALHQYDEAGNALEQALAATPEQHRHLVLAQRARLHQARGEFTAAEQVFAEAHDLTPQDATYLIYAGVAAMGRGDLAKAEALFTRAVECPEGALHEAHLNLGVVMLVQRRYEEAAACLRRALNVNPAYERASRVLAEVEKILALA